MTVTADMDRESAAENAVAAGFDRSRQILKARRHTRLVRALRIALPLASLAVVGGFAASILKGAGIGESLPDVTLPKIVPDQLSMANPHYEGFGKDGSAYVLNSKSARQDPSDLSQIQLDGITGTLTETSQRKTDLAAVRGDYNSKSGVLELFEKITATSNDGFKAEMTRATLASKENTLTTKEPVKVEFDGGSVNANTMTLRHKAREVTFVDQVVARMVPKKSAEPAPTTAPTQMLEASDAPLDITASRLDVKDADKTAVFTGKVNAVQNGQSLQTPELTVVYASKDGQTAASSTAGAGGKIERVIGQGPVVLERGADERATADALTFDATTQKGALTGNVVMKSGVDRTATSDKTEFDQAAGTVLLTGSVFVQQGKNELKGERFFINRTAGTALLTAPGSGRISAKLLRGDGGSKTKPAAKPEQNGASVGTFKTDPNAPINIDAAQLDVNDGKKTATFRGDVKAVQGDFVMKTPEMVASYTGDMKMADVTSASPQPAAGAKKSSADLTHVRANTKVNVTSADGQSVDGDWADYDVKANTVIVGGEVVLSRGGSMVRGTRMLIDMTSGETKLDTAPTNAIAIPGGGGWSTTAPAESTGTNRGRPSAVFFPKELQDANKKKQDDKPSTGTPWNAQTKPSKPEPKPDSGVYSGPNN